MLTLKHINVTPIEISDEMIFVGIVHYEFTSYIGYINFLKRLKNSKKMATAVSKDFF